MTLQPSQSFSFATPNWEWKRDTASQAGLAGAHAPSLSRGSVNSYASLFKNPRPTYLLRWVWFWHLRPFPPNCWDKSRTHWASPRGDSLLECSRLSEARSVLPQKPDGSKCQSQHVGLRVQGSAGIPPPGAQPFRVTPSSFCPPNPPPLPAFPLAPPPHRPRTQLSGSQNPTDCLRCPQGSTKPEPCLPNRCTLPVEAAKGKAWLEGQVTPGGCGVCTGYWRKGARQGCAR